MDLTTSYQFVARSSVMKSVDNGINYYILLYAKSTPNKDTGYHTVTIKSVLASTEQTNYYFLKEAISGTINGTTAFSKTIVRESGFELSAFSAGGVAYKTGTFLGEGSVPVDCTNGQAKNITVSCSYTFNGDAESYTPAKGTSRTVSAAVTLPAIVRQAIITSAANVTLGNNCSVAWAAQSAYRYKLKFSVGSWSYTTALINPNTTSTNPYTAYVIPIDAASQIPAKTGKMTATLYTYTDTSGQNLMGQDDEQFTVTVPENDATRPTISMTLAPHSSLSAPFNSLYIQGKSRVKATLNISTKYSATVSDLYITVNGTTYRSPYESAYFTAEGTFPVTATVKDSRGHPATTTQNITVIAYRKPVLKAATGEASVVAARCDAEGNLTDSGTYLKIKAQIDYEKVIANGVQNNFGKIQYRYKAEGMSWPGTWETILDTTTGGNEVITDALPGFAKSINYSVQIRATDNIEQSDPLTIDVPSESVYMHRPKGGKGMGLGGYMSSDGTLDVHWKIKAREGICFVDENGAEIDADFIVDQKTSGNWTYRKWNSGIAECWTKRIYATGSDPIALLGGFYSSTTTTLPFEMDASTITATANAQLGTGIGFACAIPSSSTVIAVHVVGNQNSGSITYNLQVKGRWK